MTLKLKGCRNGSELNFTKTGRLRSTARALGTAPAFLGGGRAPRRERRARGGAGRSRPRPQGHRGCRALSPHALGGSRAHAAG